MTPFAESDGPLPEEVADWVAELQAQPMLPAPDALLARIQSSRADGVRVLVPEPLPSAAGGALPMGRIRMAMLATGVAALLAIAVWSPDAPEARVAMSTGAPLSAESPPMAPGNPMADLLSPWPRLAYAQQPTGGRAGPFAAVSGLLPSRVVPGGRSYVRLSSNAYHDALPHEVFDLTVDTVRLRGRPALRLLTTTHSPRAMSAFARHDTLWLDRSTLRPLQRRVDFGVLRVSQDFTDSTLVETMSVIESRRAKFPGFSRVPFQRGTTLRLDPSRLFIVSESMLRVVLGSLPLTTDYRGSVGVLESESRLFALGAPGYRNVRVAGVDTVQAFYGRFEVWRVELETGGAPERWYVSRETGETLLTDGPFDVNYPSSRSWLVGGFLETKRLPPVRKIR